MTDKLSVRATLQCFTEKTSMNFRGLILLLLLLPVTACAWQETGKKRMPQLSNDFMISTGVSVGQETFIGFPKVSAYKQFPFTKRYSNYLQPGFGNGAVYVGVDASVFVVFVGVLSVGPTVGYGYKCFSVDNSVTYTAYESGDGELVEEYWTCNPKLGINIGPVWLKAGPSFQLTPTHSGMNMLPIGNTSMNVELLYLVR